MIIALFCVCGFFAVVNFQMLSPVLLVIARDLDVSPALVGQTTLAMSVMSVIFTLAAGPLADRLGRRPVLLLGLGLVGAAAAGMMVWRSFAGLVVLRLVAGAAHALIIPVSQVAVADLFSPVARGRAMGLMTGAAGLASVLGLPLVGLAADALGWREAFALYGLIMAAVTVWASLALPAGAPAARRPPKLAGYGDVLALLARQPQMSLVLVCATLNTVAWSMLTTYAGAYYGQVYHLSPASMGWLFAAKGICYSLGGVVAGYGMARLEPRLLALQLELVATAGAAGLALAGLPLAAVGFLMGLMAFGRGGAYGVLANLSLDLVPTSRATVQSLHGVGIYTGVGLGASLGAAALAGGGWPAWALGSAAAYALCALLLLVPAGGRRTGDLHVE